jgi:glutaredoxin 3
MKGITLARVQMYSKSTCPYCVRAAHLLRQKGAEVETISLDAGGPKREEMIQRTGRMTVPQIFIGDRHVGGCDDLFALERAGGLDTLLAA